MQRITSWPYVLLYLAALPSAFAGPVDHGVSIEPVNRLPVVELGYATYQGVVVPASTTPPPTSPQSSSIPMPSRALTTSTHHVFSPAVPSYNTHFLSIRYASPPVGSLRFNAPQVPATTPGVQKADKMPDRCWSADTQTPAGPPFNEDCLYVNVYVPGRLRERRDMPVVFWIHGGGYVVGSASGILGTDVYDGNDLIRASGGNVVVVVVQYRLGIFGFLTGKEVKAGGALNAGLLDQQLALTWVQKHIHKFGGDPRKVTIWGESAGAGSVIQHVIANGGKTTPPLFRGAITSSSYLPPQHSHGEPILEQLYSQTVLQAGCSNSRKSLECLRSVDITTLQAVNTAIVLSFYFADEGFSPVVVDGDLVRDRPTQLLKQGMINGDALYSVTNTLEGFTFVDTSNPEIDVEGYIRRLFSRLTTEEVRTALYLYSSVGSNVDQVVEITTESLFVCPSYFMLQAFEAKGRAGHKAEFAIAPALHGNDVAYYFTNGAAPPYYHPTFVKSFSQSFLNFAASLDPNAKWDSSNTTPRWEKWTVKSPAEMVFNRTEGGAPNIRQTLTKDGVLRRCEFWESVSYATVQ